MAAHAGQVGLAYDAKIKMILAGGLAMPFCTTKPALPLMPGARTPAHGLPYQHVTEPNYMLLANTEAAALITAITETIRALLECDDGVCDHHGTVTFTAHSWANRVPHAVLSEQLKSKV